MVTLRQLRFHETHRKVGWKPPQRLLDLLARKHPRIRLMWNTDRKRWYLLEVAVDGEWRIVKVFEPGEKPTVANTVKHLSWLRAQMRDVRKFEEHLEKTQADFFKEQLRTRIIPDEIGGTFEDRKEETIDRLWHLYRSGKSVSLHKSKRHGPRRNRSR